MASSLRTCRNCGKEYKAHKNMIRYPYCMAPACRKAKRAHQQRDYHAHKRFRRCANCGIVFFPNKGQKQQRKENSYCDRKACQTEKAEYEHARGLMTSQRFRENHPGYYKVANQKEKVEVEILYAKRRCHCGNKIRLRVTHPFSVEAPDEPYQCEECRNFKGGRPYSERTTHRVDDDYNYLCVVPVEEVNFFAEN